MQQMIRNGVAAAGIGMLLVACGGHAAPTTTPATTTSPRAADGTPRLRESPRPAAPRVAPAAETPLPPPPKPISEADEIAVLSREARELAADSAVLETIARGAPSAAASSGTKSPPLENPLRASGVTWDIDVENYEDHDRVRYWVEFFSGRAHERFGVWLERMARYEPLIRSRFAQQNLPGDLVYLALIESGFSNSAISRARAVGMWQFMRPTAKGIGLRVDRWMDERRDPVRSTDAAAKHIDGLRRQFGGSLYLAAAAYNAGGGKVSRSLAKMERMRPAAGDVAPEVDDTTEEGWSDDDFFRLHDTPLLRQETRDYVPKLIAAAIIAKEPARYGFTDLRPEPPFEADSLIVGDMTGFDVVARLAGTSVATIRDLNPQYLRWATPPGRRSVVRVPKGTGETATTAYAGLAPSERVTFATHVARKGETMTRVALRYGVSLASLREANPDVTRLRSGVRLLVPRGGALSATAARSIRAAEAAEFHRVRKGETAARIARRYGIAVAELKAWNRSKIPKNGRVKVGTQLLVSEPSEPIALARSSDVDEAPRVSAKRNTKGITTNARNAAKRRAAAPVPVVRSHVVRKGETLTALARRFGTSVAALRKANRLPDGDIRLGQRLKIPA